MRGAARALLSAPAADSGSGTLSGCVGTEAWSPRRQQTATAMAGTRTLALQLRQVLARTDRAAWAPEWDTRDDRVSPAGSAIRILQIRRSVEAGPGIGMFGYGGSPPPHGTRPIESSGTATSGIGRIDRVRAATSLGRQLRSS